MGCVADAGVNKAIFLYSVVFAVAVLFSFFASCSSVRTLVLGFGFTFGFGLVLVFRFGFTFAFAAFFLAAGFLLVVGFSTAVLVVFADAVVFLFDVVARPVCAFAFGLPGRLAGAAVAYDRRRLTRNALMSALQLKLEAEWCAFFS